MSCDRCGREGTTIGVLEPGREPLRVELCRRCMSEWNAYKARLLAAGFEQTMESTAEVLRRFEEAFRARTKGRR